MMLFYLLLLCLIYSTNEHSPEDKHNLDFDKRWVDVPLHNCREPYYYRCHSSMNCIHREYLCDGSPDCQDGDDEQDCLSHPCPETSVKCSDNGVCVSAARVCNGCWDCNNGDDERECPSYQGHCVGGAFYCGSSDKCIPGRFACDGATGQCPGDADEWCDIASMEDVILSQDNPEHIISFTLEKPNDMRKISDRLTPKILIRSWKVSSDKIVYVKPLNVSLGAVCGPSVVQVFEQEEMAAELCGNSVRSRTIASAEKSNPIILIKFRFFNDFMEDKLRGFSLKLWVSSY